MIRFTVRGIPKGQPRTRAFARGGKPRVFDPGTAEAWKSDVVSAGRPKRPDTPYEGPVHVQVTFWMPRPKSRLRRKDPDGPIAMTSKPDVDNLGKAVLDALTCDGWWRDDAQVTRLDVLKQYHAKDGVPGAVITVSEVADTVG